MAKTYQLDTMVSPWSLLARAKKAAYANGAILLGDEDSGHFCVLFLEGVVLNYGAGLRSVAHWSKLTHVITTAKEART